jgi:hypothetical protein
MALFRWTADVYFSNKPLEILAKTAFSLATKSWPGEVPRPSSSGLRPRARARRSDGGGIRE